MEAFHGARLVRLRCCARGMYLAAEEDKTSVCLRRGRRAADNVLWSARPAAGPEGAAAVLLCGSYGLFLAASDRPASVGPPDAVEAQQRALDDDSAPPPDMLWQAVCSSSEDGFLFRNCGGRFLRANGKYLRWRRGVTVAASDNSSSMLRWAVEAVPVEQERLLDLGRPGRQVPACPDLLPNRSSSHDEVLHGVARVNKFREGSGVLRPSRFPRRTDNLKIYGRRSRCTQAVKFFKSSLCDRTNIDVAALGQEDALIAKKPAQCTEQRKFPAVPWKRKSGSPDDAPANTRKQGISGNITILSPCSVILMPVSETIEPLSAITHVIQTTGQLCRADATPRFSKKPDETQWPVNTLDAELLQSLEAMLKEEKGLLQSTLKQIEEEEAKKRSSMLKMKCAQEKRRGLMAEEKRGSDSLGSHWAAMTIDIATKAYESYAIKAVGHQGRVNELECLKADKQRLIQQIKWEIEQLNTQSAP
ncbi:hypothetical protein EJB05_11788, partial [Eragrostis curvula]